MKRLWIIPVIIALLVSFGCSQVQTKPDPDRTAKQEKEPALAQTPDLADGPEYDVRQPHPVTLADLRNKYRSTFVLNGSPQKREVALTFDDAPDAEFTPQVLDALKKEDVKATFFVVGNRVKAHPAIMKRIVAEGHAVGNHSYNHANLPKLTDAEFRDQVVRTDNAIKAFTGYKPSIIRPPYGNISEEQIKWLASQKKLIVNWDVDSLDWKGLSADQVEVNVLSNVNPGSIILQHSGGGEGEDLSGTVKALPGIITKLKGDNIKLVTIPELFDIAY